MMEMETQATHSDLIIPQNSLTPTHTLPLRGSHYTPAKSDLTHCLIFVNEPNQCQLFDCFNSSIFLSTIQKDYFSPFILYK